MNALEVLNVRLREIEILLLLLLRTIIIIFSSSTSGSGDGGGDGYTYLPNNTVTVRMISALRCVGLLMSRLRYYFIREIKFFAKYT